MRKKRLQIDGHVHVYPLFDVERMIGYALQNFQRALPLHLQRENTVKIWLLTERSDCSFFAHALSFTSEAYGFARTDEEESLTVLDRRTGEPLLYVTAGRQYVVRERLEICALLCRFSQPDDQLTAEEAVRAILEEGGVPAVNWAPGKWMGARGRVVQRLFRDFSPSELLISDTTMRPIGWPKPRLMAEAEKRGFRLLCGSDPLPFTDEEKWAGTYSCLAESEFDEARPAASIKLLLRGAFPLAVCGKRSSPPQFIVRQVRIMQENSRRTTNMERRLHAG